MRRPDCVFAVFAIPSVLVAGLGHQSTWPWSVAAKPTLDIGSAGRVEFGAISHARVSQDGTIIVADGSLNRLFMLNAGGSLNRAFGREGDGPGEFRAMASLRTMPDGGFVIFDRAAQRFVLFEEDGTLKQTTPLRASATAAPMAGLSGFASGDLMVHTGAARLVPAPVGGIVRDTMTFYALHSDGMVGAVIGRVPGQQSTSISLGGRTGLSSPMFSATPLYGTVGDCLYVTAGDDTRMTVFHRSGGVIAHLTLPGRRARVTSSHRDAWIRSKLEEEGASKEQERALRQIAAAMRTAEYLPLYDVMIVDDLGYLWLRKYTHSRTSMDEWHVLHADGAALGAIRLSSSMRIHQITASMIVAGASTDIGEPRLRTYALNRGTVQAARLPAGCRTN